MWLMMGLMTHFGIHEGFNNLLMTKERVTSVNRVRIDDENDQISFFYKALKRLKEAH